MITRDDIEEIDSLKKYLHKQFQIKDLWSMKYLRNEVAKTKKGVLLWQRKYVLHLLSEAGILEYRSIDSPMNVHKDATRSRGASWECWTIQEIGRKIDLPKGDQTGHHTRNQYGESVFVSTKDYSLAGRNDDF